MVLLQALPLTLIGQGFILGGLTLHDHAAAEIGVWVTLAGLALLIIALGGIRPSLTPEQLPENIDTPRIRWIWLAQSVSLAAWVAWRTTLQPQQASVAEYLVVWLLSIGTFVQAVRPIAPHTNQPDALALRRWEYGFLLGLFVIALLVRGINLNGEPYVFDLDEAKFALQGTDIRQENFVANPFAPGYPAFQAFYPTLLGVSSGVLGQTLEAARLPSALLGALGVVAIYWLAREFAGSQVAVLASLFALTWVYHVQFSRLALNQVGDGLFATLAFTFLLRGLRRGKALDYALCGVMLGFAQLFYQGARLLPLAMLAYVLFLWLRQRDLIQRQWRLLLLVPLATLIVTVPLITSWFAAKQTNPAGYEPYTMLVTVGVQVAAQEGLTRWQLAARQISRAFLGLVSVPDHAGWYGPGSSIAGVAGSVPLMLGTVIACVAAWRHPKWALPLIWGGVVIVFGSALTVDPPQYQRYFPIVGAMALLVGVGAFKLATLPDVILASFGARTRVGRWAVPVLGALLCAVNLIFYLAIYIPEANYLAKPSTWAMNHLAREMVSAYDSGAQVVLMRDPEPVLDQSEIVKYLMADKPFIHIEGAQDQQLEQIKNNRPLALFVPLARYAEISTLQQRFPGGSLIEVSDDIVKEDGSTVFYLLSIPYRVN